MKTIWRLTEMETIAPDFGKRVQRVRGFFGLSQEEVAREIEMTRVWLSGIERGVTLPKGRGGRKLRVWLREQERVMRAEVKLDRKAGILVSVG